MENRSIHRQLSTVRKPYDPLGSGLIQVLKFCQRHARLRNDDRLRLVIRRTSLILADCPPEWGKREQQRLARFQYRRRTKTWSLYLFDFNGRQHQVKASASEIEVLLDAFHKARWSLLR